VYNKLPEVNDSVFKAECRLYSSSSGLKCVLDAVRNPGASGQEKRQRVETREDTELRGLVVVRLETAVLFGNR
jgi:hypothetical protein